MLKFFVLCILRDIFSSVFQKLRFDFELYPFTEGERVTYVIELFSLPPPTDAEFDSGLYERHVLSVPPLHGKSLELAEDLFYWLVVSLSVCCLLIVLLVVCLSALSY